MTAIEYKKQEILHRFQDINLMYNECVRYDELSHMLDELIEICKADKWIPISSIDEIPKKGAYWVTFEYENGYRETSHIGWDTFHEHWNDEEGWALDNENYVIAYMPYFEPKPYNPKGGE